MHPPGPRVNPMMMRTMMMMMLMMNPMMIFNMNPFYKLMTMQFNPLGGNGIFHPVYVSPWLMHKLENGAPEWIDPDEQAARQGNKDCSQGATVSCKDTKVKKEFRPNPLNKNDIKLKDVIIPEKVSCFAGCAGTNPCDNRIYSSHIKSEQSCDGSTKMDSWYYWTCESLDALTVFENDCATLSGGWKLDISSQVAGNGIKHQNYRKWKTKVLKERYAGKGREVIQELGNDQNAPKTGFSMREHWAKHVNKKWDMNTINTPYKVHKDHRNSLFGQFGARTNDYNQYNNYYYYNPYKQHQRYMQYNNMYNNYGRARRRLLNYEYEYNNYHNQQMEYLETIIVGIWSVLIGIIFIVICCIFGICSVYFINKIRKKNMNQIRNNKILNNMRNKIQNKLIKIDFNHDETNDDDYNNNDDRIQNNIQQDKLMDDNSVA